MQGNKSGQVQGASDIGVSDNEGEASMAKDTVYKTARTASLLVGVASKSATTGRLA